jgi:hypothetical protein
MEGRGCAADCLFPSFNNSTNPIKKRKTLQLKREKIKMIANTIPAQPEGLFPFTPLAATKLST